MSPLDWLVLFGTLGAIVAYGMWKTRGKQDMASYLRGSYQDRWYTIGLSVMATQASAVTFLSTLARPLKTECASCSSTSACLWP